MTNQTEDEGSAELPDEFVVQLRRPVEFAGQTYEQLVLKEPTTGQFALVAGKTGVEATIQLVSMVSGVPRKAIEQVGVRDLFKASTYLLGFISGGLEIGIQP